MGNLTGVIEEGEKIQKECPTCHSTFETYKKGSAKTIKGPVQEKSHCQSCSMKEIENTWKAFFENKSNQLTKSN